MLYFSESSEGWAQAALALSEAEVTRLKDNLKLTEDAHSEHKLQLSTTSRDLVSAVQPMPVPNSTAHAVRHHEAQ